MKAVVLAGGRGTRLWPLSRRRYPKQFLKLNGEASLLQQTVHRLLRIVPPEDVVVLTNLEYQFHVRTDLMEDLGTSVTERIVLEPCMRNTAPALGLAALFCRDRLGCRPEEVLFACPADHIIRPPGRFAGYVERACGLASQGHVVTFGIPPKGPETGYGYIRAGAPLASGALRAERFTEKPDLETARSYLAEGGYYWNSGMFAFRIDTLLEEFGRHAPEIARLLDGGYEHALSRFADMPDISIDYAVMERSDRVVVLPVDVYWNDVGSWDSIFDTEGQDADGNVFLGDVLAQDTRDTLVMSDGRLIVTLGLSDLLVVETEDAILVARRGDAEKVKQVVGQLEARGRREAEDHRTIFRPWGYYTVLGRGDRYQIKRVVVNPGEQLSLQMHHHRSEHWVVVRGTARVTLNGREMFVHENESVYIPKSTRHRVGNPGKVPLELIEVQNGEYVEEDDIVRFDDDYGRHEESGD